MKQNKNSIFKRLLSCLLVTVMLVPMCSVLLPIIASAADSVEEKIGPTPKVSLAWDTSTVTVTDGVAMPYKTQAQRQARTR